ncbi:MAG: prepilin-type N-terminal cleavage/methylation domain-containing protein [Phycisphaerae bacterium]
MTRTRFPPRCSGFTLIELLVVVSIIALLISLLLPALGRARDQTRTVACLANLRGTSLGLSIYTNEFNGMLPFSSGGLIGPPLDAQHDQANTVRTWHDYLRHDLGATKKSMLCPSAGPGNLRWTGAGSAFGFWPEQDFSSAHKYYFTDYGLNSLYAPRNDCWIVPQQGANPVWGSIRQLKQTSMVMELVDSSDEFIGGSPSGNGLEFRHNQNKAINLAFFDGHAETWVAAASHNAPRALIVATPWWFGVLPWQEP